MVVLKMPFVYKEKQTRYDIPVTALGVSNFEVIILIASKCSKARCSWMITTPLLV